MNTQTKIVWQISYSCDKEAYPLLWISKRLCLKNKETFMFSSSDDITNLDGYAFYICNPAYLQIS